jgi:hypothetical protein
MVICTIFAKKMKPLCSLHEHLATMSMLRHDAFTKFMQHRGEHEAHHDSDWLKFHIDVEIPTWNMFMLGESRISTSLGITQGDHKGDTLLPHLLVQKV